MMANEPFEEFDINIMAAEDVGEFIETNNIKYVYYNNKVYELTEDVYYHTTCSTILFTTEGEIEVESNSNLVVTVINRDIITVSPIMKMEDS